MHLLVFYWTALQALLAVVVLGFFLKFGAHKKKNPKLNMGQVLFDDGMWSLDAELLSWVAVITVVLLIVWCIAYLITIPLKRSTRKYTEQSDRLLREESDRFV